jgi:hypothetical protein
MILYLSVVWVYGNCQQESGITLIAITSLHIQLKRPIYRTADNSAAGWEHYILYAIKSWLWAPH